MANQTVTLLNTETGEVSSGVPLKWLGTILNRDTYVVVQDGTKSYVKKTYKPRTPKKFIEDHPEKVVEKDTEETAE